MSDVNIPQIGTVPKPVLIAIGVGLVGFVGWRFYVARQGGTGADTGAPDTGADFEGTGTIPVVPGGVPAQNTGGNTDDTDTSNTPKTDAAWTNQVADKLQQSDRWNYADIVTALGNYLADRPTTSAQQDIIRAALAVGGYPPVSGSHSIISGGNTAISVPPEGVRVTAVTATSATLVWSAVAGAAGYRVFVSGRPNDNAVSTTSTTAVVGGLPPNTTVYFRVAAVTGSGSVGPSGPASPGVSAKTQGVALPKPATPALSAISKTSVRATTKTIPNVDGYQWYLNGQPFRYTEGAALTYTGLKSRTKYTITVSADLGRQAPGPRSDGKTFTTR